MTDRLDQDQKPPDNCSNAPDGDTGELAGDAAEDVAGDAAEDTAPKEFSPGTVLQGKTKRVFFLFILFLIAYGVVMAIFQVSPARVVKLVCSLPLSCIVLLVVRLALMLLAETLLWYCYLRHLGVKIPFTTAFSIFMAGFFAGILPGRVGELIRYYLLKQRYDIPMMKTLPIHVLFTLNAGIAAAVLALPALYLVYPHREVVVAALALLFVTLFAMRTAPVRRLVIALARRTPFIKRHVDKLKRLIESACQLTKPSVFVWALPLSLVYIITMAAIVPILIAGFGLAQNVIISTAAFCVAAIASALTLLPGGVGAFETGTAALLAQIGIARETAVATAILSSALTTWPGLAVGFICFIANKRYLLPDESKSNDDKM